MPLTDTSRIILKKTGIFSGLSSEGLASVRSILETRMAKRGTVLFNEGDPGTDVFIIREGHIRILKDQDGATVELAVRGPGEIVGEMALLDSSPRFASAVCDNDCELYVLSRSRFFEVLGAHPHVAERILHVLSARVRQADTTRLCELEEKNRNLEATRIQLEAALTMRHQILEVAPYPVVVTDPHQQVLFVNRAAEKLFGTLVDRNLWSWISVRDVQQLAESHESERSGEDWRGELEIDGPYGDVILCKVVAAQITDVGTGSPGRLWVLEDLTEIRALEQQAIEHERLAMKGEMAAEIAHELKNYLMMLSGHTDLMMSRIANNNISGVSSSLQAVRETIDQTMVFIENLLHSRHPTGERCPIDFNAFLQSQIAFLRPQKRFKSILMNCDWGSSLPPLLCSPAALQQVFYNLTLNASDALLAAETRTPTVFIATRFDKNKETITLTVSDNGPGLPPDIVTRLFKERVSSKPTGHGFGIMMIARIVEDHGGTITAGRRAGGGAEFVLTLPVSQCDT